MSRIISYTEAETLNSDDYLMIDGTTDGTRKIKARMLSDADGIDSLTQFNAYNLIDLIFNAKSATTAAGVTFTWTGHTCVVTGTTTTGDTVSNIIGAHEPLPSCIIPGNTYKIFYETTNPNITFSFYFDKPDGTQNLVFFTENSSLTIPSDAVSWGIRLHIRSGKDPNGTVSKIGLQVNESATDVKEYLENIALTAGDNTPTNTDLNTLHSDNKIRLLGGGRTYSNVPDGYNSTYGAILITYHPSENTTCQHLIDLSSNRINYQRSYVHSTGNWTEWVSSWNMRGILSNGTDFNTLLSSGCYGVSSLPSTYTNCPESNNNGGILIVYSTTENITCQMYVSYRYKGGVWYRNRYINNWAAWYNVDGNFDFDALWRNISPSGKTARGLTWAVDKNENKVTCSGTWTGDSWAYNNLFIHTENAIGSWIATETLYILDYHTDDENLVCEFYVKDENGTETRLAQTTQPQMIYIPSYAVTALMRIRYMKANVAVNATSTVRLYPLDTFMRRLAYARGAMINNKKIAMFGDSIMSGTIKTPSAVQTHCVADYIQNELGVEVVDCSIGSIGYITHAYKTYNILEYVKAVDLSECTYFICSAGDNDYQYPIGTINDTNSEYGDYAAPDSGATILGQLYKLCVYLHNTYPNMTVIIIAKPNATLHTEFPMYRRAEGIRIKQLNDGFKAFCNYYGCAYLDLDNIGFDGWLLPQLLEPDGVHMTDLGYRKLSLFIAGELRKWTGNGTYLEAKATPLPYPT